MIRLERLMREKPVLKMAVQKACEMCGESDFDYLMEQDESDPAARIIAGLQAQLVEQQASYEAKLKAGGISLETERELAKWKKAATDLALEKDELELKAMRVEEERQNLIAKNKEMREQLKPYLELEVVGEDNVQLKRGETVYGGDGTAFVITDIHPTNRYQLMAVRVSDGSEIPLKAEWVSHLPRK